MLFVKLYLTALPIFFAIDLFWLGILAKNFYQEQIGHLMGKEIRWGAALLFYALYIAGLVLFAILPAFKDESWKTALFLGGVFGLICYATYDLTNLATLKGWPTKLVVYDLIWGAFISATTTWITLTIGLHWKQFFSNGSS